MQKSKLSLTIISFLSALTLQADNLTFANITLKDKIIAQYIAFYDRTGDYSGLNFWLDMAKSSGEQHTLNLIATNFAKHPKFQEDYASLDDASYVKKIYKNVLGKDGDESGVSFWVRRLQNKELDRATFVASFTDSALSIDLDKANLSENDKKIAKQRQDLLINKVIISNKFISTFKEKTNVKSSNLSQDVQYLASVEILKGINEDKNSMQKAKNLINENLNNKFAMSKIANITAPASQNKANKNSPFGITAGAVNYYMREFMLIDSFKQSGRWLTQKSGSWDTNEQEKLDLDEHGWVKSLRAKNQQSQSFAYVSKLIYHDTQKHHPTGNHIVLYDGEGVLSYHLGARKIENLSKKGRDVVNMGEGSFLIRIEQTNENDYIRNIRVIKPGGICDDNPYQLAMDETSCVFKFTPFEEIDKTQIFHPTFLNELKHYSVIRGMVMQETPQNTHKTWQDRPKLSDASYSSENGVPFEILVTYANLTNTDMWVNIPAHADDEYVAKMAQYIFANLNPKRKVWTEYFDEAWNRWGGYAENGGNWMLEKGVEKWGGNGFEALLNWYGMRTAQICNIFKAQFGNEKNRVKCTMNSQAANSYVSEQMLGCPLYVKDGGEICAKSVDYLGIAPYFGGYLGEESVVNEVQNWTLDQVFNELKNGGNLPNSPQNGALNRSKQWMIDSKKVAQKYGVGMVAYEGGQHLVAFGSPNNKKLTNLFAAANKDPRMGELYLKHFQDWKDAGGELFVSFVSISGYGGYGSWGNKDSHDQSPAPKSDAILEFLQKNPCWWENCELEY